MMRLALTFAALLLPAIAVAQAPPAEGVTRVTVPLKSPKKESSRAERPLDRAIFDLWLPEDVEVVRGVVVNPFHRGATGQKHWQAACRHWGFGLVAGNYFGIKSEDFGTLAPAMVEFGKATGHPELANAPFLFVGMSAGGGMSSRLTEMYPDRTIAAAPVCLEVGPRDAASRNVPMLTVFGERDGKQLERLLTKLPVERAEQAQWALGVQWGRRHEFGQANNLIFPFFDAVVEKQYPPELSPVDGPVSLRRLKPADGAWLGHCDRWSESPPPVVVAAFFDGDPSLTAWLPDADVARTWQAFVAKEKPLRIVEPAGLGDGQPFAVHEAGKTIKVRVATRGNVEPKSIAVYDGAVKLTDVSDGSATFSGLEPGIHALHLRGETAEGEVLLSRPHTIVVE